ncbi:AMP-binding protein [Amycolatopsis tucumanensis]|uniref:Acyl-CoA synthetase (AMP-forming)/AMP-acid ligase II n=1 Tax=Amycolatopsis tucumanensis TaxID=401106 RepID=A0ABP7HBR0_9PSEU|nr:AMP-binding protein [Amycolatopsis tucumanensis]MCF6421393.1 AMP-binding protein [Amycolatopsis tucumanensis]
MTLPGRFDAAASRVPDQKISFPSEGETLSYGELGEASRRAAAGLAAAGAGPGSAIGVLAPNSAAFLQTVLAAGRLGAAACPLPLPMGLRDIEAYLRRTQTIVDAARLTHLVTVPQLRPLTEHLTGPRVLDAAELARHEPAVLPGAQPEDTAVLQFTSGSTASPKGVVLTHANVIACADSITEAIAITAADSWGSWLPLFHDMGLFGTVTGLFNGIRLTVWSPAAFVKSPAAWLGEFTAARASICAMPNFGYGYLLATVPADRELDLSHWRVAFNGAESIAVSSVRAFLDRFAPAGFRPEAMTPAYGMAEATLVATLPPLDRPPVWEWVDRAALAGMGKAIAVAEGPDARGIVGLGSAVPGMRVRVAGGVPDGVVGEIEVTGAAVTSGYLGHRNGPFTGDGWLRTGDLGYLRDGELFFTGRSKEMITVRGENVYPLDVEAVAQRVDGVYKGRCVAFADEERIVLCAETRLRDDDERARLRETIAARCAAELGVRPAVHLVEPRAIPRTTSGKLQRLGMRERYRTEKS